MTEQQRLGVQDALWLEMDKPGNLMVVDSLFWTATPMDWDRYREVVRERLWNRYPVFRSIPVHDDDGWHWEEQEGAELEDRYEVVTLPDPGGEAELQELISSQRTVPLDRAHPLWQSLCIDNYRGGSAVLFRTHHAIADGIRMVQLSLTIFDATPDGGEPGARPVTAPEPSRSRGLLQRTGRALANPVGTVHTGAMLSRSLLAALPGDVDTIRKLVVGTRNDGAPWTGDVGERKAIAWAPPLSLDEVKEVAGTHGATVNDVLVSCVAESLRSYLHKNHGACDSVTWDVPLNLKPFDPELPLTLGNAFAIVQLELPTSCEDPLRTLHTVRSRMDRIKRSHEALIDFGVQAAISMMNKRMYRFAVDLIANRSIGVLTNVPGPQIPLYAAGQLVDGMLGWAPVTADQVMSFTIYSYAGRVFVGIAADAGRVPEHQLIVEGFGEAFRRLSLLST